MRRVIVYMVMSLDGFVGGPGGEMDWESRDQEVNAAMIPELLNTVDTMLLGRSLYESFEQAWPAMASDPAGPKELVEFARWVEDTPKMVFSNSLKTAGWKNTRLVPFKDVAEIRDHVNGLKAGSGGDMVVFGGARFARSLVKLGAVDEYRLKVQPIALGSGLPLFSGLTERLELKVAKSRAFKSGVLAVYYVPMDHSNSGHTL